jgi:hypothetical protein
MVVLYDGNVIKIMKAGTPAPKRQTASEAVKNIKEESAIIYDLMQVRRERVNKGNAGVGP